MNELPGTRDADQAAGPPVRVASFEGPLDLLLHLIRIEAIDVTAIPIVEIVRQYAAWLEALEAPDLDAVGDHLVAAATIVHMKSRRLLPPDPAAAVSEAGAGAEPEDASGEDADTGVRRAAEHLQEREAVMELVFARSPEAVAEFAGESSIEADLFALLRAFRAVLKAAGDESGGRVTRERITLVERIHWLMETLQRERRVSFRALFEDARDRVSCILTFLALLEVIRLRLARAWQSHHHEDLIVALAEEPPPAGLREESGAPVDEAPPAPGSSRGPTGEASHE